ncbi:MAG: hypothetical protein ACI4XA_01040 [Oscillospiraceae bacterium]
MKTIEQFQSEITADKELAEKLTKVTSDAELEAFLKENEVDCTAEQFKEFILEKAKKSGELTDEQLDAVAGGIDWQKCGRDILDWFKSMFKD